MTFSGLILVIFSALLTVLVSLTFALVTLGAAFFPRTNFFAEDSGVVGNLSGNYNSGFKLRKI